MSSGALAKVGMSEIATVLTAIRGQAECLTPERVVEWARQHPGSPLHQMFPWDDARAAEERRIDVARAIIRRVRVRIDVAEQRISVPAYLHAQDLSPGISGYVPTLAVQGHGARVAEQIGAEVDRAVSALKRAYRLAIGLHGEAEAERLRLALEALGVK